MDFLSSKNYNQAFKYGKLPLQRSTGPANYTFFSNRNWFELWPLDGTVTLAEKMSTYADLHIYALRCFIDSQRLKYVLLIMYCYLLVQIVIRLWKPQQHCMTSENVSHLISSHLIVVPYKGSWGATAYPSQNWVRGWIQLGQVPS